MAIHLYEYGDLTGKISEGDFSSPDFAIFDGVNGGSSDKMIYLANEHATLALGVQPGDNTITVMEAGRFPDGEVIVVDNEQMLVLSGGATAELTVQRGFAHTTSAAHDAGARVWSGYTYFNVFAQPADVEGEDESSWIRLAYSQGELDAATPGAPLYIVTVKEYWRIGLFWRRITVPPGAGVRFKTDLRLRITATEGPVL